MYYTIEKLTNRQGLSYLYKTACVYDKKTKKVLKKRQPLGRSDELQELYSDTIAHFKQLYKEEFEVFKHTQLEKNLFHSIPLIT